MLSLTIANFTVFVAEVVPVDAVTTRFVKGVTVDGMPERVPFESNDNPVPASAGADNVMGRPDAAVARN